MGSWATSLFPCQRSSVVPSNKLRAMYPFLPRELANKGVVFLSEQRLGLLLRYLITWCCHRSSSQSISLFKIIFSWSMVSCTYWSLFSWSNRQLTFPGLEAFYKGDLFSSFSFVSFPYKYYRSLVTLYKTLHFFVFTIPWIHRLGHTFEWEPRNLLMWYLLPFMIIIVSTSLLPGRVPCHLSRQQLQVC